MSAGGRSTLGALRSLLASLASYALPEGEPSPQCVQIANFPPHWVRRLDDGEWLVYNDNVSFVSCVGPEPGTYDERGFLSCPAMARRI